MFISSNNAKFLQYSLLALVGAMITVSCSKGGNSSQSNSSIQPSKEPLTKLSLEIPSQIEAKIKTEKTVTLLVQNTGSKSIKDIELSGLEAPFTIAKDANQCTNKELKPSQEDPKSSQCEIKVDFNPTEIKSGKQKVTLSYNNDVGTEPKSDSYEINYLGRGEVQLEIPELSQLVAVLTETKNAKIKITNKGTETAKDLQISELKSPLSKLESTCQKELKQNESCEVNVKFSPKEVKSDSESLEISYFEEVQPSETLTKQTKISYAGIGQAKLAIDTGSNKLIANKGKEETRNIKVTNEGTGPASSLQVSALASPLAIENDKCTGKILQPNGSCEVQVKYKPESSTENSERKISISYKDRDNTLKVTSPVSFMSVASNILNLSNYIVATSDIEIDTSCQKKQVYGNNSHNIPLTPKFTALDSDGNRIQVSLNDLIQSTQVLYRNGNTDVPLEVGKPYYSNEIVNNKSDYSKCIDSYNGSSIPDKGIFYKSGASGQKVVLGAKVEYVDKNGKISSVSTTDTGRISLDILANPLASAAPTSLFSMTRVAEAYDGSLVTRDNYRVFKISPDSKNYPSLEKAQISKLRLTNKDSNVGSGFRDVVYSESQTSGSQKYLMPVAGFSQPAGGWGESKRRFYSGYLISGSLKPSNVQSIKMSKDTTKELSLNEISSNDFGFATISYSNMPLHVWEYQWDVPFLLELNGKDAYGNEFQSQVNAYW